MMASKSRWVPHVRGLEFHGWQSAEQSHIAANTDACTGQKQISKGCRGNYSRFCGLRNTQWPDIVPKCSGAGLDFVQVLQNPRAMGGLWSSFPELGEFALHRYKSAWFFLLDNFLFAPIISSMFPLLLSWACRQAVRIKRSALGRFWINKFDKCFHLRRQVASLCLV